MANGRVPAVVRLATTLSACVLVAARLEAQATIGGDWRADVDDFAERLIEGELTPAFGVAVTVADWVAYVRGFGTADVATGRAATGDTPFYIASTTKSLTALAAVLAANRGELELDAPMVRYLPGARVADGVRRESIAVRDLITLTHGLSGDGPVVLRTAYTGEFTNEQLLELLRFHEPTGRKGEFEYNNLGYNLLGLVLEARYSRSWKEVVAREVLEPIGMRNTSAYLSRLDRDEIAQPHDLGAHGFVPAALHKDDANLHAAGGHFASARDLARYLAAHISGGRVEGRQVLPAEPIRETHVLRVRQDREFGPYHRFGWGYGWDLGTYEGDTLIHRFGGFAGYRSHVSFMPAHEIGVVVLVNAGGTASAAADLLATYIYDRLLGKPETTQRFATRADELAARAVQQRRELAAHLEERRLRLAPLNQPLEAYAGVYESPLLGRLEWRVVAGGLEARIGVMRSRAEVYDAARDMLRIDFAGGEVASFSFDPHGGPARAVTLAGEEFVRVGR
ncbi:MAG: serine hydrolase domain-containing protein [Longimicrobiales bacterium]